MPGHARSAVLFDAFGTLLTLEDPVPRLTAGLTAAGFGADPDAVAAAFAAEVAFYRANQHMGGTPAGLDALRVRCAAVFATALPSPPPIPVAHDVLMDAMRFTLFDDVVPALDALSARGCALGVVSDWDVSLGAVLDDLGLAGRFAAMSLSAVVGVAKPDAALYRHALAALGVAPAAAVMVGDDPVRDVAAARAVGMGAVLLDRAGTGRDGAITRLTDVAGLL